MMKKKCMKDGGAVMKDGGSVKGAVKADVKADKKTIAAALKKQTGKEPVKLAMGGVGKLRKDMPMTKGKK